MRPALQCVHVPAKAHSRDPGTVRVVVDNFPAQEPQALHEIFTPETARDVPRRLEAVSFGSSRVEDDKMVYLYSGIHCQGLCQDHATLAAGR